ncbi:uncharacterized protein DC041_0010088 [Schistosoma bovis]|uniref:CWH43-like N-terminal domain-containing protein n=1 Tax=Schistosoma bovis TaxID=6184 RepID=A0A430QS91_SCHBO|nr:uncharacterized protein DC041_0010088 [Schistosoma bovis]
MQSRFSTGAYPPESCIFGEGLNLAAFIIQVDLNKLKKSIKNNDLLGNEIQTNGQLLCTFSTVRRKFSRQFCLKPFLTVNIVYFHSDYCTLDIVSEIFIRCGFFTTIGLICSFFWYLIALERTKFMGIHQPKCVLNFMLLLSLVASIGLTLVGNFQQVNVELIHDIGAGMAFFGTTIYIILCALVSKRYLGTHWCIWAFRLLLGIMAGITSSFFIKLSSTIFLRHPLVNYFIYFVALINYSTTLKFLVLVSICHTVSRINFNGTQEESLTYRHPGQGVSVFLQFCGAAQYSIFICLNFLEIFAKYNDHKLGRTISGFSFYLCSTSFEWAAGFIIIVFFITWAYEFRSYALQLPQVNVDVIKILFFITVLLT